MGVLMQVVRSLMSSVVAGSLAACASTRDVHDPREEIAVADVLKSLRCELITFLDANRQKERLYEQLADKDYATAAGRYAFLDLDEDLYAGVYVTLRVSNTKSGSLTVSRDIEFASGEVLTMEAGPSLSDGATYTLEQSYALLQGATLYDAKAAGAAAGASSACYSELPSAAGQRDLPGLAAGRYPEFERFQRIHVEEVPLAGWLQTVAAEAARNDLLPAAMEERLQPGQLSYSFAISVKPGLNGRLRLRATPWIVNASVSASGESFSRFEFVLNTLHSQAADDALDGTATFEAVSRRIDQIERDRTKRAKEAAKEAARDRGGKG